MPKCKKFCFQHCENNKDDIKAKMKRKVKKGRDDVKKINKESI